MVKLSGAVTPLSLTIRLFDLEGSLGSVWAPGDDDD